MLAGCAVRPLARTRRTEFWANATEKGVHIIALEHGVLVLVRQEKKRKKSVMHVVSDTSTAATADGAVTTHADAEIIRHGELHMKYQMATVRSQNEVYLWFPS